MRADLLEGVPFRRASFTHILCTQTLKHCPDLARPIAECFRVLRPGGVFVFSVTHPDMDFTDYGMRCTPGFILSQEANIIHHTRDDYHSALSTAGFINVRLTDVLVTEKIAHMLTPESFARSGPGAGRGMPGGAAGGEPMIEVTRDFHFGSTRT